MQSGGPMLLSLSYMIVVTVVANRLIIIIISAL
jgi:hypothetical protein